jgi:hypothetical protein
MNPKLLSLIELIVWTALLGVPTAVATTYNVSDAAGSLFLTGSITTDGHIGALLPGNILGWDLTIGGPSNPSIIMTSSNSTLAIDGTDLVATSRNLYFDFTDASSEGAFSVQGAISTNLGGFVYISVGYNLLNGSGEPAIAYLQLQDYYPSPITEFRYPSSDQVIATAVPETATWAMMLLGFTGLGFLGYRRALNRRPSIPVRSPKSWADSATIFCT